MLLKVTFTMMLLCFAVAGNKISKEEGGESL